MNKNLVLFASFFCLMTVIGCDFRSDYSSRGVSRSTDEGITYSCELVRYNRRSQPVLLVSRTGGGGKNYSCMWVEAKNTFTVDGISLQSTNQPILYYKENGTLKTKLVSISGLWAPLFSEKGPTVDEMKLVFAELERNGPAAEKPEK